MTHTTETTVGNRIRNRMMAVLSVVILMFSASMVTAPPASAHGNGSNGCTLSPDSSSFPVYYNFHNQCDRHDWCYDQLWYGLGWYNPFNGGWTGRLACDQMFLRETSDWCNNYYRYNTAGRLTCNGVAVTYYNAVRNFGAPFFNNPWLN